MAEVTGGLPQLLTLPPLRCWVVQGEQQAVGGRVVVPHHLRRRQHRRAQNLRKDVGGKVLEQSAVGEDPRLDVVRARDVAVRTVHEALELDEPRHAVNVVRRKSREGQELGPLDASRLDALDGPEGKGAAADGPGDLHQLVGLALDVEKRARAQLLVEIAGCGTRKGRRELELPDEQRRRGLVALGDGDGAGAESRPHAGVDGLVDDAAASADEGHL